MSQQTMLLIQVNEIDVVTKKAKRTIIPIHHSWGFGRIMACEAMGLLGALNICRERVFDDFGGYSQKVKTTMKELSKYYDDKLVFEAPIEENYTFTNPKFTYEFINKYGNHNGAMLLIIDVSNRESAYIFEVDKLTIGFIYGAEEVEPYEPNESNDLRPYKEKWVSIEDYVCNTYCGSIIQKTKFCLAFRLFLESYYMDKVTYLESPRESNCAREAVGLEIE